MRKTDDSLPDASEVLSEPNGSSERVLTGIGVSPGLSLGTAHITSHVDLSIPEYRLNSDQIAGELERFDAAVISARGQLIKLKDKSALLHGAASEEVGFLLDAHLAMLTKSRLLRGVTDRICAESINAEAAVRNEITAMAASFAAMEDAYLAARIDDIRIVGNRLIRNLTKTPFTSIGKVERGSILMANELTPADTALIDPGLVGGFVTAMGGVESHTAIMARALGMPAVLACADLLENVGEGDTVIINGFTGTVTINPSAATLGQYEAQCDALDRERRQLKLVGKLPSVTRDGIPIALQANLELPRELQTAIEAGAAGIGLVRTEFLYMNRGEAPNEEEQLEGLLALVHGMKGQEVTIRTLDIGGDKLPFALTGVAESPNPALGLRAIRLSLRQKEMFEVQLSAILRASLEGPVRILLPMISSISQVRAAQGMLHNTADRLRSRGLKIPTRLPPLGIMIEIPGAALAADSFALESDFFAIGTNDLTQYTLAIDRGDEQVADLYNPLHPAILRLIQFTTEAAARANIPLCVCGEIAGDPRCTPLLLGLGIRTLSMAPASLTRVKQRLRGLTLEDAINTARRVMVETDERRIAELLELAAGKI